MTRLIDRLSDISQNYDVLFCDLWGCLHDGVRAFPDAVAALLAYREGGGRVVLLTNSPRPSEGVKRQLESLGVPEGAYDMVVSSGDAAQSALFGGMVGRKVWHLGPPKDDRFFSPPPGGDWPAVERVPLEQAEGIVCTGPFEDGDVPEDYRARLLSAKARGLKLLCANPDLVVDHGGRRLYCAGAIAALYTDMGGESLYFGKPHAPIYELARARLGESGLAPANERILALGDGIGTDIQGALQEDIDALFITGGIAAAETGTGPGSAPDPERLRDFLHRNGQSPVWAIGYLR